MKNVFKALTVLLTLFSLTGCGLKGPLYFPPADKNAPPPTKPVETQTQSTVLGQKRPRHWRWSIPGELLKVSFCTRVIGVNDAVLENAWPWQRFYGRRRGNAECLFHRS